MRQRPKPVGSARSTATPTSTFFSPLAPAGEPRPLAAEGGLIDLDRAGQALAARRTSTERIRCSIATRSGRSRSQASA